jgi:hypothetical protein
LWLAPATDLKNGFWFFKYVAKLPDTSLLKASAMAIYGRFINALTE